MEHLLHVKIQIKKALIRVIFDMGNEKNLNFEAIGEEIRFATRVNLDLYALGYLHKDAKFTIKKQFKFVISITFIDEIECCVEPLNVSKVIVGSPYFWDKDVVFKERANEYIVVKDGDLCVTHFYGRKENFFVILKTYAKRLRNASQKFIC
jgi:hypothetical protein